MIFTSFTKKLSTSFVLTLYLFCTSLLEANIEQEENTHFNWTQPMTITNAISMESIKTHAEALKKATKDFDDINIFFIEYQELDQSNLFPYTAILHCNLKSKSSMSKLIKADIEYVINKRSHNTKKNDSTQPKENNQ